MGNGGKRGKTGNPSPRYTSESKAKAVELHPAAGPDATYAEIARGLGCDAGSLAKWVKMADGKQSENLGQNPFQMAEELRKLRRENQRLRTENEILLKASAFFAGKQPVATDTSGGAHGIGKANPISRELGLADYCPLTARWAYAPYNPIFSDRKKGPVSPRLPPRFARWTGSRA